MGKIQNQTAGLYALEGMSEGSTAVHGLHPMVKLLGTLIYLVLLISFPRQSLGRLIPFVGYPLIMLVVGEIPLGQIGKRTLLALPFCLFAGLSNVILDRAPALILGNMVISAGVISCLGILLKTILCVSAVLALVAVTPLRQLTACLRQLHVPMIFVSLFEMTYRYVGTLLEEAGTMSTAYSLRGKPKLEMRHMGSFVGQLLIRSYDRAERVFWAMKCRGYGGAIFGETAKAPVGKDWCFLLAVGLSSLLFRLVDIPAWLGGLLC